MGLGILGSWGPEASPTSYLMMTTADLFCNRLLEVGVWQTHHGAQDSGQADAPGGRDGLR